VDFSLAEDTGFFVILGMSLLCRGNGAKKAAQKIGRPWHVASGKFKKTFYKIDAKSARKPKTRIEL